MYLNATKLHGNNMSTKSYRLSFTFGGLLIPESVEIAERYLVNGDWNKTKEEALNNEILKKTRRSSRFRYFREIRERLKLAHNWELELIVHADLSIQQLVLFLIVCRYYRFIREFFVEVVYEKLRMNDFILMDYDYPTFFERKVDKHPEIRDLSDTTKQKIQQVTIRILREAGLLKKTIDGLILQRPYVPEKLRQRYEEKNGEKELGILQI